MNDLIRFLESSPTAYHARETIGKRLEKAGFSKLRADQKWELRPSHNYYVERGGSLLFAFRVPQNPLSSFTILATHLDSPSFKLKPIPYEIQNGMGRFTTEIYGSPLLHTWMDRDLALAGQITVLTQKKQLEERLVFLRESPIMMPSLALHLDRSIADKGLMIHKQDHLKPLCSLHGSDHGLEKLLQKEKPFQELLGFDLFLVPTEKPSLWGFDGEFLSGYRLDNLSSAYAAMQAIEESKTPSHSMPIAVFWDHEEIGSMTQLGADSCFAQEMLQRIALSLGVDEERLFQIKAESICISADVSHGYHPNFPEKYDPLNAAFLGKGVAIKFNANQKYATASQHAARLTQLASQKKIALQSFASRSDIPSGSTVGSMMAATTGIATIDLGIPCLAMHSIRETISIDDEKSLLRLLQAVLEHPIKINP